MWTVVAFILRSASLVKEMELIDVLDFLLNVPHLAYVRDVDDLREAFAAANFGRGIVRCAARFL